MLDYFKRQMVKAIQILNNLDVDLDHFVEKMEI
jgi:hypothetical protein